MVYGAAPPAYPNIVQLSGYYAGKGIAFGNWAHLGGAGPTTGELQLEHGDVHINNKN